MTKKSIPYLYACKLPHWVAKKFRRFLSEKMDLINVYDTFLLPPQSSLFLRSPLLYSSLSLGIVIAEVGPGEMDVGGRGSLIFTYGTLKQGFSNHNLLQDLMAAGDAAFLGLCQTAHKLPLVCGPYRVPFLLNFQGQGHRVSGELYAVSPRGLARMDELEGVTRGHYQRLPIRVVVTPHPVEEDDEEENGLHQPLPVEAEAYYAHSSYAEALWRRNGKEGYRCYSIKEARGYVKRKDRPQNLTFLDQIQLFLSSPSSSPSPSPSPSCSDVLRPIAAAVSEY